MKMKWLPGDTITVLYNEGKFQGRTPVTLSFADDYVKALRAAFAAFQKGMNNIRVVQFRKTLHNHSQLMAAFENLNSFSTDEEFVEQIHHASRVSEYKGLANLLRPIASISPLSWASL